MVVPQGNKKRMEVNEWQRTNREQARGDLLAMLGEGTTCLSTFPPVFPPAYSQSPSTLILLAVYSLDGAILLDQSIQGSIHGSSPTNPLVPWEPTIRHHPSPVTPRRAHWLRCFASLGRVDERGSAARGGSPVLFWGRHLITSHRATGV